MAVMAKGSFAAGHCKFWNSVPEQRVEMFKL